MSGGLAACGAGQCIVSILHRSAQQGSALAPYTSRAPHSIHAPSAPTLPVKTGEVQVKAVFQRGGARDLFVSGFGGGRALGCGAVAIREHRSRRGGGHGVGRGVRAVPPRAFRVHDTSHDNISAVRPSHVGSPRVSRAASPGRDAQPQSAKTPDRLGRSAASWSVERLQSCPARSFFNKVH